MYDQDLLNKQTSKMLLKAGKLDGYEKITHMGF